MEVRFAKENELSRINRKVYSLRSRILFSIKI